jgi:murein L,D-transpeptidase YafK
MLAFPQRGSRPLVATLATILVLPTVGAAQELGGPVPLGEPVPAATVLGSGVLAPMPAAGFRANQFRFPRVRNAYDNRASDVRRLFLQQDIVQPVEILFRVFKREQLMEVWARGASDSAFVMINTYAVCGTSGELGGKRKRGDEQIPEGFYSINVFNPTSQFHLSLGVDYPNAVDRARGVAGNLGGDIFIHGGCVTVGCVPVTDGGMEEVYVMALMAREAGQLRIPVHMFPTRLDDDGYAWLRDTYGLDHPEFRFWENLREGYLAFERTRTMPHIDHHQGRYTFPRGVPAVLNPPPAPGGDPSLLGVPID